MAAAPGAGPGEIVNGFRDYHRSAEAEQEIVEAAAPERAGPKAGLLPVPGGTQTVGVTKVIEPDMLSVDPAGTGPSITPRMTFRVSDTVDFCPGAVGEPPAWAETVPISILEATEDSFGLVHAADVAFDDEYPGAGNPGGRFTVSPAPPPKPPEPTRSLSEHQPGEDDRLAPPRARRPHLTCPALQELGERGTEICVISREYGDLVDENDVWDKIAEGEYVSDPNAEVEESNP